MSQMVVDSRELRRLKDLFETEAKRNGFMRQDKHVYEGTLYDQVAVDVSADTEGGPNGHEYKWWDGAKQSNRFVRSQGILDADGKVPRNRIVGVYGYGFRLENLGEYAQGDDKMELCQIFGEGLMDATFGGKEVVKQKPGFECLLSGIGLRGGPDATPTTVENLIGAIERGPLPAMLANPKMLKPTEDIKASFFIDGSATASTVDATARFEFPVFYANA